MYFFNCKVNIGWRTVITLRCLMPGQLSLINAKAGDGTNFCSTSVCLLFVEGTSPYFVCTMRYI